MLNLHHALTSVFRRLLIRGNRGLLRRIIAERTWLGDFADCQWLEQLFHVVYK